MHVIKGSLNEQHRQWEQVFIEEPDLYGQNPSAPARHAAETFKRERVVRILELGGGQGRDTLYLAREGFDVTVLDYAKSGIDDINRRTTESGLTGCVSAIVHDIRTPLPFEENSFDACFSHMLFCMALTTAELTDLSAEVRRVLKPGGYHIYTVRHTRDPHYGKGIHRGEDIYQAGGFSVHFFNREKVLLLAQGFTIVGVEEFEEGELPRKLFRVTLIKTLKK
jgi:SAM-dependent methyltransferase